MKKSFAQILAEDRRLEILRLLQKSPGKRASNVVLRPALAARGCSNASRDAIHADLVWLEEQGLVVLEDLSAAIVATLTGQGDDVVDGLTIVPGIKNPAYGE